MNNTTILIMEEENVAADLPCKLEKLGYAVCATTAAGKEAVALVHELNPDLVIMDIHLSGDINREEAAEIIRQECGLPVIYLTAYSERELKAQIESALQKSQANTKHKLADKALLDAYEQIQAQADELQMQSNELEVQNEKLKAISRELHEANKVLLESEYSFCTMANAIPQLAWIARAEGYIDWYNERWYEYTGTTPEQMRSLGWQSMHDQAVFPKVMERWQQSIATGQIFDMKFPLRGAEGIFRPFLTRMVPLKDANGKVLKWFGTCTDISERKWMERVLRKSEEHKAFLLKLSDALRPLADPIEIQEVASRTLGEYLGVSRVAYGEVAENNTYIVFERNYVAPGISTVTGCFRMADFGTNLLSSLFDGRTIIVSNLATAAELNESEREAYASLGIAAFMGVPLNKGGRFVAELVIHNAEPRLWTQDEIKLVEETAERTWEAVERSRAEAALHESEERLRLLSDNLPDSAVYQYVHEPDGRIRFVYFSTGIERLNGISVSDVLRDPGTLHRQILPGYYEQLVAAEARSACELSDFDMELPMRRPDGQVRWMRLHSRPRRLPDGRTIWDGVQTDITKSKRAEEKIQHSRDILHVILDAAPAGFILAQADGRILFASKSAQHILGGPVTGNAHEPAGGYKVSRPDGSPVPAGQLPLSLALEGQIVTDMELLITRDDGTQAIVLASATPLQTEHEKPWGAVTVFQDITQLKRAEEVLRENESCRKVAEAVDIERRRLFDVLESLPVMITLLTPDHHIAFANRSFREKFGECGNRRCFEYCFGRIRPCEFCEAYKVLETGKPHNWESTTPDGSVYDTYDLPFTDVDGSPLILELDIDITDRKRAEEKLRDSEEKYRSIVETANEIILITNNEEIVTYVNKKIADMLGYPPEEVIGQPIWGFISKEYRPIVKKNLEKRRQGISESYESKLRRKDGSSVWVLLNVKPLFDREGKYIGAMSMLTDISKRKEAEAALNSVETARKKEIHHRIKNNLQVISSLLDLQAEQFNNRECIKNSEVLEAFKESQDRVISMALIHEELHKGNRLDTLDISSYIESLTNSLCLTYSLGNADISLTLDLEKNVFFDMDTAVPLGMIINELVSNSFKHAFPGRNKGEIRIELHRDETAERMDGVNKEELSIPFTLSVSDNGVGIPESFDIEDFDSLGLQLVTTLVDQLDGKLELKRNEGTKFTIRFSVAERNEKTSASSIPSSFE